MRRWAIALALVGMPLGAAAVETRLPICVASPSTEREAAVDLDRWVATAAVEVRATPCRLRGYSGSFVERGGQVLFVLATPDGGRLERGVPWLRSARAPLSELAAAGRLSEFSVLVEALLAEDRLASAWAEEPQPAPVAKKAAPRRRGGGKAAAEAAAAAASAKAEAEAARAKAAAETAAAAAKAAEESAAAEKAAAEKAAAEKAAAERALAAENAAVNPAVAANPPEPAGAPGAASGGAPTPPADANASGPAGLTRRTDRRGPILEFQDPGGPGPGWHLALEAGGRLRGPGIAAPEVAATAGFGILRLRGSLQAPVDWDLEGHAIEVSGLSVEAGVAFELARGPAWHLEGGVAAAADRLSLLPLYRSDGASSVGWDLGPAATARFSWRSLGGWGAGLSAGLQWMPTAATTHVGANGPSATLNAVGARAAVELSFDR